jgi:hypothetical protein
MPPDPDREQGPPLALQTGHGSVEQETGLHEKRLFGP